MTDPDVSIRIQAGAFALDLAGPRPFVEEMMGRFDPFVRRLTESGPTDAAGGSSGVAAPARSSPTPAPANPGDAGGMPDEFGEWLTLFPRDVTDVDRVLIAAFFAQQADPEERAFSTRAVNKLLQDQGVKVSNASECVRRNTSTKRAFALAGGGKYRVSRLGEDYLNDLRASDRD